MGPQGAPGKDGIQGSKVKSLNRQSAQMIYAHHILSHKFKKNCSSLCPGEIMDANGIVMDANGIPLLGSIRILHRLSGIVTLSHIMYNNPTLCQSHSGLQWLCISLPRMSSMVSGKGHFHSTLWHQQYLLYHHPLQAIPTAPPPTTLQHKLLMLIGNDEE